MRMRLHTVKSRVILLMIVFAVTVAVLVSSFSFYLMFNFQRRTTIQSTEFNLQLVASVIEHDLMSLTALGTWCTTNSQIADYFQAPYNSKPLAIAAYNRMREEYSHNRARRYVHRLIVVDNNFSRILQINDFANASRPVTVYSIRDLGDKLSNDTTEAWEEIVLDPFYHSEQVEMMPFICPVEDIKDRTRLGSVYLAVSLSIITDKLQGYQLPDESDLYLSLGDNHYRIAGSSFEPVDIGWEHLSYNNQDASSQNTTVAVVRGEDGKRRTLVSYPVRSGIRLTQVLAQEQFVPQQGAWAGLLLGICMLILALALFITYNMDRSISRPVARLRQKIAAIADGDFSPAPELESESELGQVGRGVNRLARDVVALMERRIADEKRGRDLEYRMLQNQINPHFLYNTLNSIKWMATIQGADGIAEMTTALARLLKTIAKDIRKIVPLQDELSLLDDYIVIQKYRYGGNITYTKEIETSVLLQAMIPRFSLQPLVENAIFHGIEPKGAGNIHLKVQRSGQDTLVSIRDDGIGMAPDTIKELFSNAAPDACGLFSKMGIRNVDERLRYAFGEEYGLSVQSVENQYTVMVIRLPMHDKTSSGEEVVK